MELQISLTSTFHQFSLLAVYRSLRKSRKVKNTFSFVMVSIPYAWSTPSPHHARESFSKSFKMRRGDGKMTLQKLIISSGRNQLKFGVRYKTCPPYHAPGILEFQFFSHSLSYFARRTLNSGSQSSFDFCAGHHCQGRRWHKLFAATTVISGRLPARPITRTGRLPAPADYPHRPIIAYGEKRRHQITRTGG